MKSEKTKPSVGIQHSLVSSVKVSERMFGGHDSVTSPRKTLCVDGKTIVQNNKIFKKLEQAQENYPMWASAISGMMAEKTDSGFVLKETNVQTFEKKPKESKEATPVVSAAS